MEKKGENLKPEEGNLAATDNIQYNTIVQAEPLGNPEEDYLDLGTWKSLSQDEGSVDKDEAKIIYKEYKKLGFVDKPEFYK